MGTSPNDMSMPGRCWAMPVLGRLRDRTYVAARPTAWRQPGGLFTVAEELVRIIGRADLHASDTLADVRTWRERAATFLVASYDGVCSCPCRGAAAGRGRAALMVRVD